MCAGCFIHLLADARLKEELATCPNCRCEISKSLCCRNLAVEKAVSELPSECGFCMKAFPRSLLERHKKEECQDRVTQCKYKRIGCPWQGPYHELTVHESECCHPTKTGNELMEILDEMDQSHKKEMQLYNSIFGLLSFEKIGYTGVGQAFEESGYHVVVQRRLHVSVFISLSPFMRQGSAEATAKRSPGTEVQFRPYRTDDFITRLYYETPRFTVLNQTWVLKARVNDSERNPNLSCKRTLSFQLILKSKINSPHGVLGPYDDVKIHPVIYHFVFTNENNETEYVPLPIIDSVECNKLLAAKNINLRLFIFQIQKCSSQEELQLAMSSKYSTVYFFSPRSRWLTIRCKVEGAFFMLKGVTVDSYSLKGVIKVDFCGSGESASILDSDPLWSDILRQLTAQAAPQCVALGARQRL
ncbi:unnamed protein product [Ranitomeya imitator]|uniref:Cysteine and histidine-rich protein 1 n=1 Tax=Ranitomeya imitator TaxID=111125 RepID=A0ABN9LTN1_9NEOB|nr:unnamed protein product [Ranitomeya imitator]